MIEREERAALVAARDSFRERDRYRKWARRWAATERERSLCQSIADWYAVSGKANVRRARRLREARQWIAGAGAVRP